VSHNRKAAFLRGSDNPSTANFEQCPAYLVRGGHPGRAQTWHLADSAIHIASVDLDECIERLYRKELLADSVIEAVCAKTKELLMKESNVVHIQAPVTVVGDIHGQFFDMIEIFRIGGYCPDTNYLFLGRSREHATCCVHPLGGREHVNTD
jgi:hypothetical protein